MAPAPRGDQASVPPRSKYIFLKQNVSNAGLGNMYNTVYICTKKNQGLPLEPLQL